jgi:hypothetical protein
MGELYYSLSLTEVRGRVMSGCPRRGLPANESASHEDAGPSLKTAATIEDADGRSVDSTMESVP